MRKWKVAVGVALLCSCGFALAQVESTKAPATKHGALTADTLAVRPAFKKTDTEQGQVQALPIDATAQQAQDNQVGQTMGTTCATAALVTCGTPLTFSISGTTANPGTRPSCWGSTGYAPQWFYFVATGNTAAVNTCAAPTGTQPGEPDTELAVYSGTCAALTQIGCSDDDCAYGSNPAYLSSTTVSNLTAGTTYYVLVTKWSSGTGNDGSYVLSVSCYNFVPVPCQTADQREWEFDPCGQDPGYFPWYFGTFAVNNGCNATPVAFAEVLQCNSTICGSSTMTSTLEGTTVRDLDWYKFSLEFPGRITLAVNAEFAPVAYIAAAADANQPISCNNFTIVAGVETTPPAVNASVTYPEPNQPVAPVGEYWLIVSGDWSNTSIPCTYNYRATVTVQPCAEEYGACCLPSGTLCYDATTTPKGTRAYCAAQGGRWWGPGSSCASVNCNVCPAGYTAQPAEAGFNCAAQPYIYSDSTNPGCGGTTAKWTILTLPDPNAGTIQLCGVSGTFFDQDPNGTQNLRDNDWYQLGTGTVWPVGVTKSITATVTAEFPVEVLIAKPGYGWGTTSPQTGYECQATDSGGGTGGVKAWQILATATGEAGQTIVVTNCVTASPSNNGRAWVIVRPAIRGTPREIPCGVKYGLKIDYATGCTGTGACCYTAGCALKTFAECTTLGGAFWGLNTTCDQGCCACEPTDTPENETVCAFPDTVNSSCFYISGGTVPTAAIAIPITPGTQTICGTGGWVQVDSGGYIPEMDCYGFTVPTTGTIRAYIYSEFDFNSFLVKKGTAPDYCDDVLIWYFGFGETRCQWNFLERLNIAPGDYQVCVRLNRDDERGFNCNDGEHPKYAIQVELPGTTGACCFVNAGVQYCGNMSAAECAAEAGAYYYGDNTTCDDTNVCAGACCTGTTCALEYPAYCADFKGYGTTCDPNPCAPVDGACCVHGACSVMAEAACTAAGGTFKGAGSVCTANTCPCVGDGNCDHQINWRDIDYLIAGQNDNVSAWTALFPSGPTCPFLNLDTSGDSHVNWRDIDPFIALMNTTCP